MSFNSWLQSPSAVILEPPQSLSLFPLFPHHISRWLNVSEIVLCPGDMEISEIWATFSRKAQSLVGDLSLHYD